jgi:hypothetical protein
MEIIARSEAKAKGLKRYFTGKPCKHGHVSERYVVAWHCCECAITADQGRRKRGLRTSNSALERQNDLKRHYGITVKFYDWLLAEQGSVCAACRMPETVIHRRGGKVPRPRALAVDHDHVTGEVRGLLCQRCNAAEGQLQSSPARTRALLRYNLGEPSPPPSVLACEEMEDTSTMAAPRLAFAGLTIPVEGSVKRLVWGKKAGEGEVSSFDLLTRLQQLRDGG